MLPAVVTDALPPSPRIVEVGVGGRFDLLAALHQRLPGGRFVAVDVDPDALADAPNTVRAHVDDVHEPRSTIYRGTDLVLARRPPVELQPAIARLALAHDADLAMRALKDEWADLEELLGPPELPSSRGSWRWWPVRGRER